MKWKNEMTHPSVHKNGFLLLGHGVGDVMAKMRKVVGQSYKHGEAELLFENRFCVTASLHDSRSWTSMN